MAGQRAVVVRFRVGMAPPYDDSPEASLGALWTNLEAQHPGIDMRRRIRAVGSMVLESLAGASFGSSEPGAARLLRTFEIVCPSTVDPFAVTAGVKTWARVESAYVQPRLRGASAAVQHMDDPEFEYQGYLFPAPTGLNSLCAWQISHGAGEGARLVDIEAGWNLGHGDLPASIDRNLIIGTNSTDSDKAKHGLMTLGVLAAADNVQQCIGFTPNVEQIRLASVYESAGDETYNIENAIAASWDYLHATPGGVILLELEVDVSTVGGNLCVEILPAVRDAILLAVAAGVVVVEPAGNGSTDLSSLRDEDGKFVLDPAHADFEDSGAILVGAATPNVPHEPVSTSWKGNFGSRVDCYAWGQNVTTLGIKSDGSDGTNIYEGTSSAAACVAGAVALFQGLAAYHLGSAFEPTPLREYLRAPENGTESADPANDKIGVMPDLAKLIKNHITTAVPDVYSRDFVGDDGSTSATTSPLYRSPDIIVRQAEIADPQTAFGEGSGKEDDDSLSEEVASAADHWVYLRVHNKGGVDATNVQARLYWAEPSALILPDSWNEIGTVTFPSVPAGNVLTVSPGLKWPAAEVPAAGHYCFLAEIIDPCHPTPMKEAMADFAAFVHFVRIENNVVWRNFNVVKYASGAGASMMLMAQVSAPTEGGSRDMRVDVETNLPPGAEIEIGIPGGWIDHVERSRRTRLARRAEQVGRVPRVGRTRLVSGRFPPGERAKIEIRVKIPPQKRFHRGRIVLSQSDERGGLGRVTWEFVPEAKKSAS